MIRQAQAADTPAIAALWNPVIRDTTITFTSAVKTADGLAQDIALKAAQDLPFLLAETAGGALQGFATYGPFRNGPGYAHTMEHTIILAPEARGQSAGAGLMAQLQAHAAGQGCICYGRVSAPKTRAVWRFTVPSALPKSPACPRSGANLGAGWI